MTAKRIASIAVIENLCSTSGPIGTHCGCNPEEVELGSLSGPVDGQSWYYRELSSAVLLLWLLLIMLAM